jgi:NADPH-dependent 2,4-dienoyl-CoA reductase/sulfur reductase-like enzyme
VVVGAGAAGLMAAIRAAEHGRRVLLLENARKLFTFLTLSATPPLRHSATPPLRHSATPPLRHSATLG